MKYVKELAFALICLATISGCGSVGPEAINVNRGNLFFPTSAQLVPILAGTPAFVTTVDCVFNAEGKVDDCSVVKESRPNAGALIIIAMKKYAYIDPASVSGTPAGIHRKLVYHWSG